MGGTAVMGRPDPRGLRVKTASQGLLVRGVQSVPMVRKAPKDRKEKPARQAPKVRQVRKVR
jgi:hypothetical protein